jgi:hypothetical protein
MVDATCQTIIEAPIQQQQNANEQGTQQQAPQPQIPQQQAQPNQGRSSLICLVCSPLMSPLKIIRDKKAD